MARASEGANNMHTQSWGHKRKRSKHLTTKHSMTSPEIQSKEFKEKN